MNTLKIAALSLTLAAASMHADSLDLTGKVPMDFKVGGQRIAAGSYRIAQQRPGVAAVRDERGHYLGFAVLPLHTSDRTDANTMTFVRRNGEFHLNSVCAVGSGCWSAIGSKASAETIQIAMNY